MPEMMDTVPNLGLRDGAVAVLAERTRSDRFAWDSHRRFVQMFGNVVHGIDGMLFEQTIREAKSARGVSLDTELETDGLRLLVTRFKHIHAFEAHL
jgi:pyruvate,orthophosphate dikinase